MDELKWYGLWYDDRDFSNNYEISNTGIVRNVKTGHILAQYGVNQPYIETTINGRDWVIIISIALGESVSAYNDLNNIS